MTLPIRSLHCTRVQLVEIAERSGARRKGTEMQHKRQGQLIAAEFRPQAKREDRTRAIARIGVLAYSASASTLALVERLLSESADRRTG